MQVNIKGLINRLDDLRERLNRLFDKLEKLDDLEQEEMAIEDVEQYFQNDDTFNLSIALDILEQVEKLDKALEIIKEKEVAVFVINDTSSFDEYNVRLLTYGTNQELTKEEYNLLKETLK